MCSFFIASGSLRVLAFYFVIVKRSSCESNDEFGTGLRAVSLRGKKKLDDRNVSEARVSRYAHDMIFYVSFQRWVYYSKRRGARLFIAIIILTKMTFLFLLCRIVICLADKKEWNKSVLSRRYVVNMDRVLGEESGIHVELSRCNV